MTSSRSLCNNSLESSAFPQTLNPLNNTSTSVENGTRSSHRWRNSNESIQFWDTGKPRTLHVKLSGLARCRCCYGLSNRPNALAYSFSTLYYFGKTTGVGVDIGNHGYREAFASFLGVYLQSWVCSSGIAVILWLVARTSEATLFTNPPMYSLRFSVCFCLPGLGGLLLSCWDSLVFQICIMFILGDVGHWWRAFLTAGFLRKVLELRFDTAFILGGFSSISC